MSALITERLLMAEEKSVDPTPKIEVKLGRTGAVAVPPVAAIEAVGNSSHDNSPVVIGKQPVVDAKQTVQQAESNNSGDASTTKRSSLFDLTEKEVLRMVSGDSIALDCAYLLKTVIDEELRAYQQSEDMRRFVDSLKRRERERVVREVEEEIEREKQALLVSERARMQELVDQQIQHEMAPIYNRLRIEQRERELLQQKLQQESERLREVLRAAQLEEEERRQKELAVETQKSATLSGGDEIDLKARSTKISFGLTKKKTGLF
eukprot:gene29837-36027_t